MTPIDKYMRENEIAFDLTLCRIDSLVEKGISRIKNSPFGFEGMYVGHSGGKDSVVVRFLADNTECRKIPTLHTPKNSGSNAVHDLTKQFLYEQSVSGLDILYTSGNPRDNGFKVQIDGTREAEFDRTDGRSTTVHINGKDVPRKGMPVYVESGLFGLNFIYPIVDFSDMEVWAIIYKYGLPFSEEYCV